MRPQDLTEVELIYKVTSGETKRELFLQRLEALLDQPLSGVALVAQKASEPIVGYMLGEIRTWEFGSPRSGWIYALGVDPLYQRQGVGSMLLERARIRFEELGISTIRTLVHEGELPFVALFEACGFRRVPYAALELDLAPAEDY
jgi:ribosomal protein S18 acetylase RimI-like enzyme